MNKKVIAAIIAAAIVIAAGTGIGFALKNKKTQPAASEQTDAANVSLPAEAAGKMTLMVYMLGSDLESKSGAGTEDLEEMAASGADLSKVNVIVYAGGAKSWQNEDIPQDKNTVLRLTESGFEVETTFDSASMGEAQTLADFINYAYQNHPAERYAMIFWDHGNGPVIGYGKDMLFGKDSLTLSEMKVAIESSPFGPNNKLCFVGFDACLMASAELTLVWADYADYLVASQETEPAFGWKYSFLSAVNGADTGAMLGTVTADYLAACEEYYDERGFENRDTTLSCVDLSKAGTLSDAIENLFGAAAGRVQNDYHLFAASRVQTRALGRASTGSEYDLVDLADMAAHLQALCPKESEALLNAIGDMVTSNATNAQQCCGMSLYYPFYNKYYYGSGWAEAYEALDILPNYLSYLKTYAENWLVDETEVEKYATSIVPSVSAAGTYTVTLTPEEKERFASATYHILRKEGKEAYSLIYSSRDVTENNGVLTANFNGKIIYITNKYNEYGIPVVTMADKVNDYTRYFFPVSIEYYHTWNDSTYQPCTYHLVVNNETDEISVAALLSRETDADASDLLTGKVEDVSFDGWTHLYFPDSLHRVITRSASGLILPINSWLSNGILTAKEFAIQNGVIFKYDHLAAGEYRLIFEITDTQGNRYCTEPIELQTETEELPAYESTQSDVTWSDGDRTTLYDGPEAKISLEKAENKKNLLLFRIENKMNRNIRVSWDNTYVNGSILSDGSFRCDVPAGETETEDFWFNENLLYEPDPIKVQSLRFRITVDDTDTAETLLYRHLANVKLTGRAVFTLDPKESRYSTLENDTSLSVPFCGVNARNKQIYNENGVKIDLLRFGRKNESDTTGYAVLRISNTTDETVRLASDVVLLDDIVIPTRASIWIPPRTTIYKTLLLNEADASRCGVNTASSLTLEFQFDSTKAHSSIMAGEVKFCPVPLDGQHTSSIDFKEGKNVIYNDHGIRIAVLTEADDNGQRYLSVVNNSDEDISLDLLTVIDGKEIPSIIDSDTYVANEKFRAHSRGVCVLGSKAEDRSVSIRVLIRNFIEDEILYTADEITTLTE